MFQSTHPRRVRPRRPWVSLARWWFQSTHPRRVRRPRRFISMIFGPVSIHAPAKGATLPFWSTSWHSSFQSTHPRRVRLVPSFNMRGSAPGFNPRTREGCDQFPQWAFTFWHGFNPRTREGCDAGAMYVPGSAHVFQSTHPRRVRLDAAGEFTASCGVSIHAPAKGAT